MLCERCKSIDFGDSTLHSDAEAVQGFHRWDGMLYKPSDGSGKYLAYGHHPRTEDLVAAAEGGCHFCIQIRDGLWRLRGHEDLHKEHHKGPIEIRYYQQTPTSENGVQVVEFYAVAMTPNRNVKVAFDFVQYPCQSEFVLSSSLSHTHTFVFYILTSGSPTRDCSSLQSSE